MNKFFSIVPENNDPFLITWDLGPRCNYDCSYCPSHRHDNFSPHASLDELKNNLDFLFDYLNLISKHRIHNYYSISFTGGEPTTNPNFIEFCKYLTTGFKNRFSESINLKLDVTSNGAMSKKIADAIIENFEHITISYHTEANDKLKSQVKQRILQFADSHIKIKVNVMFHRAYFEECKDICQWLKENNIDFIPRLIGENPTSPFSHAHLYTDDQKEWLKTYWNIDMSPFHRPCCGGRSFKICSDQGTESTKSVNFRNFKHWSCSVNWYFLHLEQHTGLIYHHQTCQATLDGTRGPIGTMKDWKKIILDLENRIENKNLPLIKCPNLLCGCGLCTPKSKNRHDLLSIMPTVIKDVSIISVDLPS